jgi:Mg-chelatase subunit ChlD
MTQMDLPKESLDKLRKWIGEGGVVWVETDLAESLGYRKDLIKQLPSGDFKGNAIVTHIDHDITRGIMGQKVRYDASAGKMAIIGQEGELKYMTPLLAMRGQRRAQAILVCALKEWGKGLVVFRSGTISDDSDSGKEFNARLLKFCLNHVKTEPTTTHPADSAGPAVGDVPSAGTGESQTKPASSQPSEQTGGNANHVVFCIQATGSMAMALAGRNVGSVFDGVREQMLKSISHLTAAQDFQVVIFQDAGAPIEMPAKRLQPVTPENRVLAARWLGKVIPHGTGGEAGPALDRCFDILNAAKGKDKAIILVTDGTRNNNAILKCIRDRNTSKDVHVFIVLYGEQNDESAVKIMRDIATETGGKYKNITE